MASIKAIEGRSVHQIQSGQVIVDLNSVVKELVENSLDAGATSVDVRFKNNGLDSIEIQDNGAGISRDDYDSIALKHYTSKLGSYSDLSTLQTFGFRGEALSSLCAVSDLRVTTAQAEEAPKGARLDFEHSGKLRDIQVTACQKGTTVAVENLFFNLPVRRRELEKNIKREYAKVLGLLQAYACVTTEARLSVSNVMAKGKKSVVFATRSSQTTRDNIANVFGTKALSALVAMNLTLGIQPSQGAAPDLEGQQVHVRGHVSRPIFGEGRNAPDRQMFFVNGRPCALPQLAKVFNEVYKSYNVSQSPFIFADIILDTNAYDVNVSPDKRTILLHDQNHLLESLRVSLTELFEQQDQTVPHAQKELAGQSIVDLRDLRRQDTSNKPSASVSCPPVPTEDGSIDGVEVENTRSLDARLKAYIPVYTEAAMTDPATGQSDSDEFMSREKRKQMEGQDSVPSDDHSSGGRSLGLRDPYRRVPETELAATDANTAGTLDHRPPERRPSLPTDNEALEATSSNENRPIETTQQLTQPSLLASPIGAVPNAFDRMRPRRHTPEIATITIGAKTTSRVLGSSVLRRHDTVPAHPTFTTARRQYDSEFGHQTSQRFHGFAAPSSSLAHTTQALGASPPGLSAHAASSEEIGDSDSNPSSSIEGRSSLDDASTFALSDNNDDVSEHSSESSEHVMSEEEKKRQEDDKVANLIRQAEESSRVSAARDRQTGARVRRPTGVRERTTELVQTLKTSTNYVIEQCHALQSSLQATFAKLPLAKECDSVDETTAAEERLTLTVSKDDFAHMHIIGQFNLGFILALRNQTDLLIIDQHASDEKINFERLQATSVVQNQNLVQPLRLELTAVDEEIILENDEVLVKNGFQVNIDDTGKTPVGQRCSLTGLPVSKEVTFGPADLEELVALLAETPYKTQSNHVPRPSKVRRMFAMRACRSSIMIGKTLQMRQMEALVRKLGTIDKPWNCPHGRPTMRHLCDLHKWNGWVEGDGLVAMNEDSAAENEPIEWMGWLHATNASASGSEEESADDDGDISTADSVPEGPNPTVGTG